MLICDIIKKHLSNTICRFGENLIGRKKAKLVETIRQNGYVL